MKVFISWSGALSRQIALALREWLPLVIQDLQPYMSEEDIEKGIRWALDLATELDTVSYGILCLTPENVNAPWMNFEAGALSKSLSEARVAPLLFGMKPSDLSGPLAQFQATSYGESEIRKLVRSLNANIAAPLAAGTVEKSFDTWWPQLRGELDPLADEAAKLIAAPTPSPGTTQDERLDEILELARHQQRALARLTETSRPSDREATTLDTVTIERIVGGWNSFSAILWQMWDLDGFQPYLQRVSKPARELQSALAPLFAASGAVMIGLPPRPPSQRLSDGDREPLE